MSDASSMVSQEILEALEAMNQVNGLIKELKRKVAGGETLTELEQRQVRLAEFYTKDGRINLAAIAYKINKKKKEKEQLDEVKTLKSGFGEDSFGGEQKPQKVIRGGSREDFQDGHVALSQQSQVQIRQIKKRADQYTAAGGDSLEPHICTVSFPGRYRGDLFFLLKVLKFKMDKENGDIHAMNDASVGEEEATAKIPNFWKKEFGGYSEWNALLDHAETITVDGTTPFREGLLPRWFVEHWGYAAWMCAQKWKETGAGIIVFENWAGYKESYWCQLEYLFCKCLVRRYGKCVFVQHKNKPHHMTVED